MTDSFPMLANITNIEYGTSQFEDDLGWGFYLSFFVYQDYIKLFSLEVPIDLVEHDNFRPIYIKAFEPSSACELDRSNTFVNCGRVSLGFYSFGYSDKQSAEETGVLFRDTLLRLTVAYQFRCDPGFLTSLLRPKASITTKFYMQSNGVIQFEGMPLGGGSGSSAPIFETTAVSSDNIRKFLVTQPISDVSRRALAMRADFILLNSGGIGGSGDQSMAYLAINVSLIESFVKQQKMDESTCSLIDDLKLHVDGLDSVNADQKLYIKQGLGNLKSKSIKKSVCEYVGEQFPVGSFTAHELDIKHQEANHLMGLCYDVRSKYFHSAAHQDLNVNNLEEHDLARFLVAFAEEIATKLIEKNI